MSSLSSLTFVTRRASIFSFATGQWFGYESPKRLKKSTARSSSRASASDRFAGTSFTFIQAKTACLLSSSLTQRWVFPGPGRQVARSRQEPGLTHGPDSLARLFPVGEASDRPQVAGHAVAQQRVAGGEIGTARACRVVADCRGPWPEIPRLR